MSRSELHDWECAIKSLCGENADKMLDIAQDIYNTAFVRGKNFISLEHEPCEDCISRKDALYEINRMGINAFRNYNKYSELFDFVDNLPSVTPSYNSIKTELKPCEDCISREEAKKLIQGKIDDIPKNKDGTYGSMFGQYVNGLYCAKTAISYMPSVVPQTKRGNWIKIKDECEGVNFYDFSFECSKCGKEQSFRSNFCPNCGADMRESEEEK